MNKVSKRIQYPTDEVIALLGKTVLGHYATKYFMIGLNKENENNIDSKGFFVLPNGEIIHREQGVFCGSVDIEDSKDAQEFRNLNFIFSDLCPGSFVPADFNYKDCTGEATDIGNGKYVPRLIETFDPVNMYRFAHAKLGKPKKVVIFKRTSIMRD